MIRFENVGMRYGMGPEVLRDVSFELKSGSLSFLTGPSGAGKSSLLRLMYLAHRPSRGHITMFGEDISALGRSDMPPLRRRIGVVFQEFRLLDHLSALENVCMPLRITGAPEDTYLSDVRELLTWVGLGARMNATPPTLSGGEKQRVAIARAVVARPDLLLADEPTGNVDPELGIKLLRLFMELNRMGTTIMIATHDLSLVERTRDAAHMHIDRGHLTLERAPVGAMAGVSPEAAQ